VTFSLDWGKIGIGVDGEMKERGNFERFKNTQRHILKELGDNAYVKRVIDSGDIRECYDKNWNAECYYLLGMIDYLCHKNSREEVREYDDIRKSKLEKTLYPTSIVLMALMQHDDGIYQRAFKEGIEEFRKYNIIEKDVYDIG